MLKMHMGAFGPFGTEFLGFGIGFVERLFVLKVKFEVVINNAKRPFPFGDETAFDKILNGFLKRWGFSGEGTGAVQEWTVWRTPAAQSSTEPSGFFHQNDRFSALSKRVRKAGARDTASDDEPVVDIDGARHGESSLRLIRVVQNGYNPDIRLWRR